MGGDSLSTSGNLSHAEHKNRHCHTQRTKTGTVTRSAQKQALSHAAHKNRHCHTQRTKTGTVTCSAQKQVLSHAAHKSRYCHTHPHCAQKQVLSHAATSCTKAGIVTRSHIVHESRYCHTQRTKAGIVIQRAQKQAFRM